MNNLDKYLVYCNKNKCKYTNNKKRICKKECSIIVANKSYCSNHSKLLFNQSVTIIQKCFKGYRTRKKLKNLFYNLPDDLQKKIIYYINEPIYYKKYCMNLNSVIRNKSIKILNIRTNRILRNDTDKLNINYITTCYKLFNKYSMILYLNELKYLYALSDEFLYIANHMLFTHFDIETINYIIDNEIFELIDLKNNNMDEYLNMIVVLNKYKTMYQTYYNIVNYRQIL